MDGLQKVEVDDQTGEHDGNGGDQLDQDVQRGTGSVLEGVAHGVADDGGLVVRFTNGSTETVQSGEISVRGMYGYF